MLNYLGPRLYNFFHAQFKWAWSFNCSYKLKCWKIKIFLSFNHSGAVFIMLINVKMPTIVGILKFISMINFMLRWVKHEKFYNIGTCFQRCYRDNTTTISTLDLLYLYLYILNCRTTSGTLTVESETRAYLWTILNTIYKNTCFEFVKETSPWDVSFMHTKHMGWSKKKTDDNHFFGGGGGGGGGYLFLCLLCLHIIQTFHTLK